MAIGARCIYIGLLLVSVVGRAESKLVRIPAGQLEVFWAQSQKPSDGNSTQRAEVSSFEMSVYPVTVEEFARFLRSHPEWQKGRVATIFAEPGYLGQFRDDLSLKSGVSEKSPVAFVSWFAARAYCTEQGMRLPTTLEWEYVAAASAKSRNAMKDPEFLAQILEWYSTPRPETGLAKVGQRPANAYGVHDLHGLIWEWVEDFNSSFVTGESRADSAWDRNLFCGGGGLSEGNKKNYAAYMRFAARSSLKAKSVAWNVGFRCVRSSGGKP